MKKLLLLLVFCAVTCYAQSVDEITTGVKQVLTDKSKGLSDSELKALIERYKQLNKEVKDDKDFSMVTNIVAKTEFDTVTILKENNIYQLKAETEGNYFVVKYIDLELPIDDFRLLRNTYETLTQTGGETKSAFLVRKRSAYDAKNKANPYKIYYSYLHPTKRIWSSTATIGSLNIATIPFKIFPKTKYPSSVSGDIDNVGLYGGLRFYDFSILKANGKEIKSNVGAGIYLAPSVVKLDKDNSSIIDDTEVSKMYLTTAFAFHIKYQSFTIMIVPAGMDIPFSESSKQWDYDGKYWWGFGLGIDTSLFNF